jgi:hypothetical protein
MSDATHPDFEALLKQAFAPVDPPASLSQELETRLTRLNEAAWEELEQWAQRPAQLDPSGAPGGRRRDRHRGRRRPRATAG